ncbi:MAG: CapA family protein [Aeromicrobium sp.]
MTIAFAGDVHTADPVDPTDPAYAGAFQQLREADVAMVNLETAVATSGTPADKRFLFRADPAILDKLASWGVDLVTMANNHALDYGRDGLEETLLARDDANLGVLGVGRTADQALSPAQITVRGSTITFLAAKLDDDPTADPTAAWAATKTLSGVASASDPAALLAGVERHSDRGAVVVFLHWGIQGNFCPNAEQVDLAAALRRAGADVIIGAHSHTIQSMGQVGDGFVAYGLGNFMWWRQSPKATPDGGVLTVTLDGETVTDARWTPHVRDTDRSAPRARPGQAANSPLATSCQE